MNYTVFSCDPTRTKRAKETKSNSYQIQTEMPTLMLMEIPSWERAPKTIVKIEAANLNTHFFRNSSFPFTTELTFLFIHTNLTSFQLAWWFELFWDSRTCYVQNITKQLNNSYMQMDNYNKTAKQQQHNKILCILNTIYNATIFAATREFSVRI